MTARRLALALALVPACGGDGAVLAPVIELPAAGSDADPLPTLDTVELSVAHAGDPSPLALAVFTRGEPLALDGVPYDDDLVIHLIGRNGDSEVAYGRTCRFELAADAASPAPHLWFTRTVHWGLTTSPVRGDRTGGGAWTSADHGVAVALGADDDGPVTAVEHLDVGAGAWTEVATVTPRRGGVLAPLGDGRAVLLGGRDGDGAPHGLLELVDPLFPVEAERVEAVADPRLGVDGTAAALLQPGDVVVMGGRDLTGAVGAVWALRLGEDNRLAAPRRLATLTTPRHRHTLTRLSDDLGAPVVVIGGLDDAGAPVAAAELYRPLGEAFSTTFAAALLVPRSGHASVRMPDGSVLVVGGIDAAGAPVRTLELFSIDGGFVAAGELPVDAGIVEVALTALPDGRILLSGGRTSPAGPAARTAYVLRLDPLDGSVDVAATDDLEVARAGHVAVLLCDGTALAVGGAGATEAERYQPPSPGRR